MYSHTNQLKKMRGLQTAMSREISWDIEAPWKTPWKTWAITRNGWYKPSKNGWFIIALLIYTKIPTYIYIYTHTCTYIYICITSIYIYINIIWWLCTWFNPPIDLMLHQRCAPRFGLWICHHPAWLWRPHCQQLSLDGLSCAADLWSPKNTFFLGGVPSIGVPKNGWFIAENTRFLSWKIRFRNGWFGDTPILGNLHMVS